MKVFWAWQSDTDQSISRHFIKDCLEKAIQELRQDAEFTERDMEIDHDTKNVPGSPPITDTIFEKISEASIFVGDVTPVATADNGKKIMNPNVAIEIGFATAKLTSKKIITVMNTAFGDINDLPFDLRYKRGPVLYILESDTPKDEKLKQQKELVYRLKNALKLQDYVNSTSKQTVINYDLNGPAIFFDLQEPIYRESEDGWSNVRNVGYQMYMSDSYIYTKTLPNTELTTKKADLKNLIFNNSKFFLKPLLSEPTNTPIPNKYGVVVVKSSPKDIKRITDITQCFTNGAVVGISNSFLNYSSNRIHLNTLNHHLIEHFNSVLNLLMSLSSKQDLSIKFEIGLINKNNCTIIRPNLLDKGRYYPEPELGPLENKEYIASKTVNVKNAENDIANLSRDFIISLFEDLGYEFDFDTHKWD